jgi:hypothetical protein
LEDAEVLTIVDGAVQRLPDAQVGQWALVPEQDLP